MAAKFSLQPMSDRVVVQPLEEDETTISGLVIPDTAKEKPTRGKVVAVGPGKFEDGQRSPMDVKPGDIVIYKKWGGDDWKDKDGTEYMILGISDIIAIVQ